MSRYNLQVNKTSRHTVLFMINIGATQATVDYLLQVLHEMASLFSQERQHRLEQPDEETYIPLPEKRIFHAAFLPFNCGDYLASDMRQAYYQGSDEANVVYVPLSAEILLQVQTGRILVSANFVTPYPPGFPVILPGQIITIEILIFFQHIKIKEIHGFDFTHGFKVFRDDYLDRIAL